MKLHHTQILKAKETDQRAALFARAIKSGRDMQSANRKLLLRMRLCVGYPHFPLRCTYAARPIRQQADLVVKAPMRNQQAVQNPNQGGLSDNIRVDMPY